MSFQIKYIYDLVDKVSPSLRRINSNVSNAKSRISRSSNGIVRSFKKIADGAIKAGSKVKGAFGKMKAGILALTAAATSSAISFGSLELGLVNVQNLLSKDEVQQYTAQLKQLQKESVKSGFSIENTNKALFDTISALGASENSIETFRQAQKLAIAGVTDLSIAVDGITSIVNAYGRETTDANRVANAFFTAQKAGKTTVAELSSSIGQLAPIAKAAGVGFEEALAAVSALTLGGLSTDEAVTSLKGAFSSLIKPTDEAAKILKAMGVPFGAANIEAQGLSKTLLSLTKAQEKYGVDAIAKAIPNIRAFTAVTALGEDKLKILDDTIVQISSDVQNGTGLLESYNKVNGTLAKTFARTTGSVKIFAGTVGESFSKQLKSGLNTATGFIDKTEEATQKAVVQRNKLMAMNSDINIGGDSEIKKMLDTNINNNPQKFVVDGQVGVNINGLPKGSNVQSTFGAGNQLPVGVSSSFVTP